jgi:hypothetical protein
MRVDFRTEGRGLGFKHVDSWLAMLREPAPPPPGEQRDAKGPSTQRLSRSGQVVLGLALCLLAVLVHGQTFETNQQLSQRFRFCPPLGLSEWHQMAEVQQTQSLINNLSSATPGQKLRLRQQSQLLLVESARLCGLASLYRSQEVALMTTATVALCVLSLSVVLGLSHGLMNNTNRTLITLQVTSALALVVPMAFLQLGEQMRNTSLFEQLYLARLHLHEQLLSTLANQNLPVWKASTCASNRSSLSVVPGLTDPSKVADLISRIDRQSQSSPPIPLNLNDATEKQVFGFLSTLQGGKSQ